MALLGLSEKLSIGAGREGLLDLPQPELSQNCWNHPSGTIIPRCTTRLYFFLLKTCSVRPQAVGVLLDSVPARTDVGCDQLGGWRWYFAQFGQLCQPWAYLTWDVDSSNELIWLEMLTVVTCFHHFLSQLISLKRTCFSWPLTQWPIANPW